MDTFWSFFQLQNKPFLIVFFVILLMALVANAAFFILEDAKNAFDTFRSWLVLLLIFIVGGFFLAVVIKGSLIILYTPIPGW